MTVSNTSPLVENKTGNGVWTTIAVTPGQILQNSDGTHAIKVIKTTIADGTTTTLAETTDYTVALDGTSPSTGTITLVAGAPSSAYRYTVLSSLTPKQEVNLQNGTIVDMEDIESALDRLTLYAHKQDEKLERAVVLAEDTLTRDLTLDSLDSQAGKVLRVNSTEDGFDYVDVTDGISQATFDINSLTVIDSVVTSTDKLPIYDVSTGLTKYVVPDNLGLVTSGGTAGQVQQIQYATKTDTQSISIAAAYTDWQDVTGLSVTITPSATTSKLLIGGFITSTATAMRVVQNGCQIAPRHINLGLSATGVHAAESTGTNSVPSFIPFQFLVEVVGSTSAQTIKVQVTNSSATTVYINRSVADTDTSAFSRSASHIYVMEITEPSAPTSRSSQIIQAYNDTTISAGDSPNQSFQPAIGSASNIKLTPLSSSSYTSLLTSIRTYAATDRTWGNEYINDSAGFTATSPGSRQSAIAASYPGAYSGTNYSVTLQESSTSPINYTTYSTLDGATGNFVLNSNLNTYTTVTTAKWVSNKIALNFVTTSGSTWKQCQIASQGTTETSSSIANSSAHTSTLTCSITPTSASNYIFMTFNAMIGVDDSATGSGINIRLTRDGSPILVGDTAGSKNRVTGEKVVDSDASVYNISFSCILPATAASATTIGFNVGHNDTSNTTVYVNRSFTDSNTSSFIRGVSQISLIEIDPIA